MTRKEAKTAQKGGFWCKVSFLYRLGYKPILARSWSKVRGKARFRWIIT